MSASSPAPLASVVVPAKNEAQNLDFLLDELRTVLAGQSYEIIVVDDGSDDNTAEVVRSKPATGTPLRYLRHERSHGKSMALRTGLAEAQGGIIVTVDGDGQNDPIYVPQLVKALEDGGPAIGIAAGERKNRTDGSRKKYASRFANRLRRKLLDDETVDSGCGLKAVRRDVFLALPYFEGYHRFLPALVLREGFGVVRIDVVDRPRRYGTSHYGVVDRGVRGVLDLFGVWWLRRRSRGRAKIVERS